MIALFKGLGLLLQDNELYRAPFEKQLAHWKAKSEAQLHEEVELLARAKCQWLIASIVLWQASALLILGLITNYLWRDDFDITVARVRLLGLDPVRALVHGQHVRPYRRFRALDEGLQQPRAGQPRCRQCRGSGPGTGDGAPVPGSDGLQAGSDVQARAAP